MHNLDTVVNREGTKAVKTELRESLFGKENIIPMWVADMDFPAPQEVIDALIKRAAHPIYGYTVKPKSYFESLKNWLHTRHQWDIETHWCLHSPTVLSSLSLGLDTLAPAGASVVIQTPVYAPFYSIITRTGRKVIENPLLRNADGSYSMDFEHLESLFANESKHFIFCSPHNPVGRVWTRQEIERLATLIVRYNVTVFSDEIHCDLVFPGHKHTPLVSIAEELQNHVVTCLSPTKTFNLAGLAVSAVIIPNHTFRTAIKNAFLRYSIDEPNLFGIEAFEAAFTHGENWLNNLLTYLNENRLLVEKCFSHSDSRIQFCKPEGTYLAWLNFNSLGWDAQTLAHKLVHEAGLALEPGLKFGYAGEGFARLNFACTRSVLSKALRHIENLVTK
jgi:cystathionine beta-lyase